MSQQITVQSRYAEVNGQRLHYKLWSENGPPLVFLHGVTSSSAAWDLVAPRFASDYAVMAFDLRGHGLSSKPASGYTWVGHYAADLLEFVKAHLREPVILIGHSLGAVVTVPIAVGAPDRVRAIVMEDPPAFRAADDGQTTRDRFRPVLELKRLPRELRIERFMQMQSLNRNAATRRADELEAMSEQVLIELMEGNSAYRPEDWFPRVACPSLVMLGSPERGGVVSWEDRPRLERLLKGARVVEWDDVGHLIHFQKLDQFVAEVKAFLKGLA